MNQSTSLMAETSASSSSNWDHYLNSFTAAIDLLPQPYRMINEVVEKIIQNAIDRIEEDRKMIGKEKTELELNQGQGEEEEEGGDGAEGEERSAQVNIRSKQLPSASPSTVFSLNSIFSSASPTPSLSTPIVTATASALDSSFAFIGSSTGFVFVFDTVKQRAVFHSQVLAASTERSNNVSPVVQKRSMIGTVTSPSNTSSSSSTTAISNQFLPVTAIAVGGRRGAAEDQSDRGSVFGGDSMNLNENGEEEKQNLEEENTILVAVAGQRCVRVLAFNSSSPSFVHSTLITLSSTLSSSSPIQSLLFSPDSTHLSIALRDGTVSLYQLVSASSLASSTSSSHSTSLSNALASSVANGEVQKQSQTFSLDWNNIDNSSSASQIKSNDTDFKSIELSISPSVPQSSLSLIHFLKSEIKPPSRLRADAEKQAHIVAIAAAASAAANAAAAAAVTATNAALQTTSGTTKEKGKKKTTTIEVASISSSTSSSSPSASHSSSPPSTLPLDLYLPVTVHFLIGWTERRFSSLPTQQIVGVVIWWKGDQRVYRYDIAGVKETKEWIEQNRHVLESQLASSSSSITTNAPTTSVNRNVSSPSPRNHQQHQQSQQQGPPPLSTKPSINRKSSGTGSTAAAAAAATTAAATTNVGGQQQDGLGKKVSDYTAYLSSLLSPSPSSFPSPSHSVFLSSPITSSSLSPSTSLLALGCSSGLITLFHTFNLSNHSLYSSHSCSISSLAFYSDSCFLSAATVITSGEKKQEAEIVTHLIGEKKEEEEKEEKEEQWWLEEELEAKNRRSEEKR